MVESRYCACVGINVLIHYPLVTPGSYADVVILSLEVEAEISPAEILRKVHSSIPLLREVFLSP